MIYGIDVNALTRPNRTGVERYVYELITEMMKAPLMEGERVFLYASAKVDELGVLPAGWEWRIIKLPILTKGWTHLRLSYELLATKPDVFFSPAHEIPLFAGRIKIVNTIHDIAFVHVPKVYTFFNRMRQRWAVARSVKKSDKILTVSETTRDDLGKFYQVQVDRMIVTRLGIRPEDFRVRDEQIDQTLKKYNLKAQNYLITVGRVEKKKGISFLIDVFEKFRQYHPDSDLNLVLAGKMGNGQEDIINNIESSKFKDQIHVLGFVPEEDLAPLMIGSLAYVFPSTYEGFGIPALEAMAAGTPVIASDIPALREVCGDAAIIRSTNSVDDWVEAIGQMQNSELRSQLVQKGTQRSRMFNWSDTAQKTWEVLRG
ncbi:glycosyltransferase family 4 protein [Candidatus Uhrbacteria bacterium]|jgi:glycosyltransferase involved in cell wall biosynthesis|nr:glycosyltransferase family 4 protein [Candidatus Uhrbacteria bacterium]MBT7716929.1 glycosyltransferase family 4 protein [Candidatus Uhrbacteria bacterium]